MPRHPSGAPSLWRLFDAGRVRRWHVNPDLSWTEDYLDGHQGRVARLILALHPNPHVSLLSRALTHDDGEWGAGDLAQPVKARLRAEHPECLRVIEAEEARARSEIWPWGLPDLYRAEGDEAWLHFCDRLDAWMWCARWAPRAIHHHPGWLADRRWIYAAAAELGVGERVNAMIAEWRAAHGA